MVGAALLLASAPPAQRVEVPLTSVLAPNYFFTCSGPNWVSIGIDYDDMHREMDFSRLDNPTTAFTLADPVKSVVREGTGPETRWIIHAEGPARNAEGLVAADAAVQIELVISQASDGVGVADFSVRAGDFTENRTGCRMVSPRPRPGHPQ